MLGFLLALVLYVATWPVVEIKLLKLYEAQGPFQLIGQAEWLATGTHEKRLYWISILYAPLHELRKVRIDPNPLSLYWLWWVRQLQHPRYYSF